MPRDSELTANRELTDSREPSALLQERTPVDRRDKPAPQGDTAPKGDKNDPSTWALLP